MTTFRALVRAMLRADARWTLRRDLDGVFPTGLDSLRDAAATGPVIVAANHVAWWDGLLAQVLSDEVGVDATYVVEARTLERYPFLASVGARGIDPSRPTAVLAAFRDARRWLDRPGRVLWLFPQGRHRPSHLRPLDLRRGVEVLARDGVRVVPCAIQYVFADAPRPRALVGFGPALSTPGADDVERALCDLLDAQDADLAYAAEAPAPTSRDFASTALAWAWRMLA